MSRSSKEAILLWDRVQPRRMVAATGILLFIATCVLSKNQRWKFSWYRYAAFSLTLLLPWLAYKYNSSHTEILVRRVFPDLAILPITALAILLFHNWRVRHPEKVIFVAAVATNIAIFGSLQAVQSAEHFFDVPSTPATKMIDYLASHDENNLVALDVFEGAVLNGLGYKSVGHAFLVPMTTWYKPYFPDMSEARYNYIFNRFSNIRFYYGVKPDSGGMGVDLPLEEFNKTTDIRKVLIMSPVTEQFSRGGDISRISINESKVTIIGWARWSGISKNQTLTVVAPDLQISAPVLRHSVNRMGGEFLLSSFYLTFELQSEWSGEINKLPVCLLSSDKKLGEYVLDFNAYPDSCTYLHKS